MSRQCLTYASPIEARAAADRLLEEGVPAGDLSVVVGLREHDVRGERVGGFAGSLAPQAPVGTFFGARYPRARPRSRWISDPRSLRQGSFEDVERDTVVRFDDRRPVEHALSAHALWALVREAAGDDGHARTLLGELHDGRALLLLDGVIRP